MSEGKVGLVQALVAARQGCRATVHKADYNKHVGYSYVSHEQVLVSGARAALLENGLALEQRKVEYVGEIEGVTAQGKRTSVLRWLGTFALCHVSGEERTYQWEATTQGGDKAAYVASTMLDKVAHLRVLQLAGSDEENAEHDANEPKVAQQGAPAPQQAAQQTQAKADPIAALIADLKHLRGKEMVVAWAAELAADRSSTDAKKKAWAAFGARCEEMKLDPREIAALARRSR